MTPCNHNPTLYRDGNYYCSKCSMILGRAILDVLALRRSNALDEQWLAERPSEHKTLRKLAQSPLTDRIPNEDN